MAIAGIGAVSDPGASARPAGRAARGQRPAGGRAAARLRRGPARPVRLHRRRREGQGRSLFVVVIAWPSRRGAARLTLRIDRRPCAWRSPPARARIAFGAAGVAALLVLVVVTVGFDLPDRIDDQHREFVEGTCRRQRRPARPPDQGRQQRPARDLARRARGGGGRPVEGRRAGTFRLAWERDRPAPPEASSTGTRSTTRWAPSSGGSGSCCCWSRSRTRSAWRSAACGGRSAIARRLPGGRRGAARPRGGRLGLGDARASSSGSSAPRVCARARRRGEPRASRDG